ncbi:hypothetical protein [Meiothermus granaticius]|uniref:Uncharacterized protein n=1 Tax=Meiothermus granaticius NBRC 107808 TaxID=1227551 RepID=A0A399FFG1_9DEIN|nr:hypothetical protein [Meiothermus granaticius]RIH94022.1 hypothetical protein Mgrana_00108 [Meiothermus granaticius NBRC 107808]GEM88149.1 hypothetical protein MGR01S_27740 [Meiothermus granaticius NBRC 107808]
MRRLPWGAPAPALSPEQVERLEARDRAQGLEMVRVLDSLALRSRLASRVQQITGYLPVTVLNPKGGWFAVAHRNGNEVFVQATTELEALLGLVRELEGVGV